MGCLATLADVAPGVDPRLLPPDALREAASALDQIQIRQARGELMPRGLASGPACFVERVATDEETGEPIECADFHLEWQEHWSAHALALVIAPVGHGKTQQLLHRVIWEIGRNPNIRIGVVCANDDQAVERVEFIRRAIETNARIHEVFPELRIDSTRRSTDHEFTVVRSTSAKNATVTAFAVGSKSITGARLDLLILDDVLDLENTETPGQRRKIRRWFDSKAFTRLPAAGHGRCWVIGTPWHAEDLLHVLEGRPDFHARRYSAVVNPDSPRDEWRTLWSAVFTPERARFTWRNMHPAEFARTYLARVIADADRRFAEAWLQRALQAGAGTTLRAAAPAIVPGGPIMQCVTGVDLGVGEEEGHDLSALVTIGLDTSRAQPRRVLLDIQSGRWNAPEIVRRIQATHTRFRSIVHVENNAAQDHLRQFVGGENPIPVVGFHTSARKKADPVWGIESLAVEMRAGLWVFPSSPSGEADEEEVRALLQELRDYRPRKHVGDRLMALWIAREGAREHVELGAPGGAGATDPTYR